MDDVPISCGALKEIFEDVSSAERRHPFPVLQCLQIKPLSGGPPGGPSERFRIVLSDVNNYCQSMLATQANAVIKDDVLKKGNIVRIKGYQANSVKGKNILVILNLDVLHEYGQREKIGKPEPCEVAAGAPAPANDPVPRANASMSGSGFYGSNQPKKEETSQATNLGLPTRALPANRHANNVIYPIEALSPYSNKWTIKARVSQKSPIRTWHKPTSEGKLFSCNFLDESGEIRATGFNEQCDALYELLVEGEVYYITAPCKVSLAKKQFTNLSNDYELTFERDTIVTKAEDASNVPLVNVNIVSLQDLEKCEKDSTVDVCGVLREIGELQQAVAKASGKPYERREIQLVDDSGFSVRATLWNKTASSFETELDSILALKGCKVSDYGGRTLSLLNSGQMLVNPDITEAHRLKGWWDAGGRTANFQSYRDTMGGSMGQATGRSDETHCIADVKNQNLGEKDDNPDYFGLKATIVYIKQENFCYPACKGERCSKKVVNMGEGWRCEACDKTWDEPNYRYIMSVNVNDHTGQLWLSCFDDVGRVIMGVTADELMAIQEAGDEARKAAIFEAANCRKLSFRCRAKKDTFGDVPRVRYQVMSAVPLDYKMEGHRLADMIKQMSVA